VPALTFWATGSAVLLTGAKPVVVDVEPENLCIDVGEAERVIARRTKAIIAVYNYGTAPNIDGLLKLAEERSLSLVEDCARAHGFEWRRRPVGCLGDIGAFSFQ
jgi:dTDP-4-amino-4,6-dideoxygalactose transaminase